MTFKHRNIVIAYMDGEEIEWSNGGVWKKLLPLEDMVIYGFYNDHQYRIKPKEPMYRVFRLGQKLITGVVIKNSSNQREEEFYQEIIKEDNTIYLTDWLPFPPGTKI